MSNGSAQVVCKDVAIRYMVGDFRGIGLKEWFVRRLTGKYEVKSFWAVDGVTFSLKKGDFMAIIGSNGAGKSTLLKAISGIMEPSRGRVLRRGALAPFLELASGFDPDLTVRENAYLRGAMLGYSRAFMDAKYDEIIAFAELKEFEDRPFRQLSSGMKSRLAFALASLVEPDILILDEVLSVGDGAFQAKSAAKMREIMNGAITILVSHSLGMVRQLANKVLWLEHGKQIAFTEDVKDVCDAYEEFLRKGGEPVFDPEALRLRREEARRAAEAARRAAEEARRREEAARVARQWQFTADARNLALAAVVKNEAANIREWIDYHRLLGVDRFYVFDNGSTDDMKGVLKKDIDAGLVVYATVAGEDPRREAYRQAVERAKEECRYLGFVDVDEFLSVTEGTDLIRLLAGLEKANPAFGGLVVQSCEYAADGRKRKPGTLVLENFLWRAAVNPAHLKTINARAKVICNPRKVISFDGQLKPTYVKGCEAVNSRNERVTGPAASRHDWDNVRLNRYAASKVREVYDDSLLPLARILKGEASGWKRFDDVTTLFAMRWYLAKNPDVRKAGVDPLSHYQHHGWKEGRQPSPRFDGKTYLTRNPDVARAKLCPLIHYLRYGQKEHRPVSTVR